jgi:hypothetical protein
MQSGCKNTHSQPNLRQLENTGIIKLNFDVSSQPPSQDASGLHK